MILRTNMPGRTGAPALALTLTLTLTLTLALALALTLASAPAKADPVLPIDIRNGTECDISLSVAPHPGQVAAPAGQVARLLVTQPPAAVGSNSLYHLESVASAEGCDAHLAKPRMPWLLVRSPDGHFYVNPEDPAKPGEASAIGNGTPTLVFAGGKDAPITLSLTTE